MKAELEVEETEHRGIIVESETPKEKEVLERTWLGDARVVAFERLLNGQVKIVVAPTPQGGDRDDTGAPDNPGGRTNGGKV